MPRSSLLSLFDEFARFSSGVAIVQQRGYRRDAWTYQKLTGAAVFCAFQLKERGVQTGDRVLLWGPNSAEWVAAFWGCLLRGAVVVPLDDSSTLDFASRVAADAGIKFAFASRSKPHLAPAIPTFFLEDLPATSEPRGVVLTHGNFLANLEPVEKGIAEYRKYERWLHPLSFVSVIPLSHVFGQFMALFVTPLLGATVVFENTPHCQTRTRHLPYCGSSHAGCSADGA